MREGERREREEEGFAKKEERERVGCSCQRGRGLVGAQWVWSGQVEESIAAALTVNSRSSSRSAEGGAANREYLSQTSVWNSWTGKQERGEEKGTWRREGRAGCKKNRQCAAGRR